MLETKEIEGEVVNVKERISTKFGLENRFWIIRVRGEDFYAFKYPNVRTGDYVEIEYVIKEGYKKIVKIHKTERKKQEIFKTEEELHNFLKNIKEAFK